MKIFVFAVQCGGKTTLAKLLRDLTDHEVVEMDDEIMRLNNGIWPKDFQYKVNSLEPIVYKNVQTKQDVIFMDNHLHIDRAKELKQSGFSLVLMEVTRDELLRRNNVRFESGAQSDASRWIDMELENAQELRDVHLIDHVISGEQSSEQIAQELLVFAGR